MTKATLKATLKQTMIKATLKATLKQTMIKATLKATLKLTTIKATLKATLKQTTVKATLKATLKQTVTEVLKAILKATPKTTPQHPSSPPSTYTRARATLPDEKQTACTGKAEPGKKQLSNKAYELPLKEREPTQQLLEPTQALKGRHRVHSTTTTLLFRPPSRIRTGLHQHRLPTSAYQSQHLLRR